MRGLKINKQVKGRDIPLANTPEPKFVDPKSVVVKRWNNGEYRQNSDNTTSTHKMASYESDGKYYAAPTIYPKDRKGTKSHDPKDWYESPEKSFAFADTAVARKERYGPFKTEKEAKDFAANGYKKNKNK
jgi:hypothetical protein